MRYLILSTIIISLSLLHLFNSSSSFFSASIHFSSPASRIRHFIRTSNHLPRALSSTISTPTGTFRGKTLRNIEQFLGIPFCQAPIHELRFSSPLPLARTWNKTVVDAIAFSSRCVQETSNAIHEDCLHLNIFRPKNTNTSSKLPVMVWIFGGSFVSGDSSNYDPTDLLLRSVKIGRPVVYVSIDYRLGVLGFLQSDQLRQEGALNLGLQDQRMAFTWIKQNIQYFSGDSKKITAFGESAGAVSISLHMLSYGGSQTFFRGAIMESGAPQTSFAFNGTSSYPASLPLSQDQKYNMVLNSTACTLAVDQLDCLRKAPLSKIRKGQNRIRTFGGFPFAPAVDGLIIPSYPSHQLSTGKFSRIPFITGNNLDEATSFISKPAYSSMNMTKSSQLVDWVLAQTSNATLSQVVQFLRNYPDIPDFGSPYDTGPVKFLWKEYKRCCSCFGDIVFNAPRRNLLLSANKFNPSIPVWSYLFSETAPSFSPSYLGVYHGTEIAWIYGESNQTTVDQITLSHYMMDAWIDFSYELNPNGGSSNPLWPPYTQSNLASMQFKSGNTSVIKDNFRSNGISYIINNPSIFGQ